MDSLVRAQPINRILAIQTALLIVTSLLVVLLINQQALPAYVFGGLISIGNTLLQKWHLHSATIKAKADVNKNLGRAYLCSLHRWLMTITMFAIGFSVLTPEKMLLAGFIVLQMSVFFSNYNRV